MAIKIDVENQDGQVYGYWTIPIATQYYELNRLVVDVVGYKNRVTKEAGKTGWHKRVTIEGDAYQRNMTIAEIEAAVMASPEFTGSTTVA